MGHLRDLQGHNRMTAALKDAHSRVEAKSRRTATRVASCARNYLAMRRSGDSDTLVSNVSELKNDFAKHAARDPRLVLGRPHVEFLGERRQFLTQIGHSGITRTFQE